MKERAQDKADLSLINLRRRMVFPELSFWKVGDLLPHPAPNAISYPLIQTQHIRVHLLDLPALLAIAWTDEHDEGQDLLTAVVGPHERVGNVDRCVG